MQRAILSLHWNLLYCTLIAIVFFLYEKQRFLKKKQINGSTSYPLLQILTCTVHCPLRYLLICTEYEQEDVDAGILWYCVFRTRCTVQLTAGIKHKVHCTQLTAGIEHKAHGALYTADSWYWAQGALYTADSWFCVQGALAAGIEHNMH